MMLTQDEMKRLRSRFDGSAVLDTNLKREVLKEHLEDCMEKIQTKLKRIKPGGKVVVCWGDVQ